MPPVPRIKKLRAITNYMKVIRNNLALCEGTKNYTVFKQELIVLKQAVDQLDNLKQDTDDACDGYVTVKAARQALWAAARDLELGSTLITELIEEAQQKTEFEELREMKFFSRLMNAEFALARVKFSPEVPRKKMTKAELMAIQAAETSINEEKYTRPPSDSNLNTSQAGSLGDAQLGALGDMIK